MLSGKMMHCEEPKSRGPAASKLLTHFSKPEPNRHIRPRNFILTGRKAPDAVELCAPWGSSQNVRFCIYQRQHPTSLLSSTERGLSSNANRLIFKGVRGGPPPSSRLSMGSVFGLFQRGKQNGRDPALFGASESGSSKAQLKVFECLASLSPLRRMRREGGPRPPADRCFSSHKSPTPRSPSHVWLTEEWSRAAGLRLERSLF